MNIQELLKDFEVDIEETEKEVIIKSNYDNIDLVLQVLNENEIYCKFRYYANIIIKKESK